METHKFNVGEVITHKANGERVVVTKICKKSVSFGGADVEARYYLSSSLNHQENYYKDFVETVFEKL